MFVNQLPVAHRRMNWCVLVFAVCVAGFLAGCGTTGAGLGSAGKPVETLHLIGTSLAIDLDNKPGADGLGVRVYAGNQRSHEPVRIGTGTLELLLFDGAMRADEILSTEPMRAWSYDPAELRKHEQRTTVGVSYAFIPVWGDARPTSNRVTVVARYKRGQEVSAIYSAPVSVPLPVR
jgi:hypothetical protein